MKTREGKDIQCAACNNLFYVPKYRIKTAKFCSLECQNHKQYDKYIFNCVSCDKKVITSPSRRNYKKKFCSIECRELNAQSDKERRRKQKSITILRRGHTKARTLRRYISEYKEMKCQKCGYDEHEFCLDMHHIDEDPTNNVVDNIAILCAICHRVHHHSKKK